LQATKLRQRDVFLLFFLFIIEGKSRLLNNFEHHLISRLALDANIRQTHIWDRHLPKAPLKEPGIMVGAQMPPTSQRLIRILGSSHTFLRISAHGRFQFYSGSARKMSVKNYKRATRHSQSFRWSQAPVQTPGSAGFPKNQRFFIGPPRNFSRLKGRRSVAME